MGEPAITVLLSTYNRRAFLPAAIESVRMQTFGDWRLLAANDGGEDVSDVVGAYGDPRIEYFDRPHLGKAAQMNFLMRKVESRYVGYMDDDDVMLPRHLEALVGAAESSGASFVYSDLRRVFLSPSGRVVKTDVPAVRDVGFDDIRMLNAIGHPLVAHTKELADRIGPYDERLRILIDYDYIRRLAKAARPVHVREVTYEYRLRLKSDDMRDFNSVSGLWKSSPETAGRSLLALFEKDPAALSMLYQDYARIRAERDWIVNSPYWRLMSPLRAAVRSIKRIFRK